MFMSLRISFTLSEGELAPCQPKRACLFHVNRFSACTHGRSVEKSDEKLLLCKHFSLSSSSPSIDEWVNMFRRHETRVKRRHRSGAENFFPSVNWWEKNEFSWQGEAGELCGKNFSCRRRAYDLYVSTFQWARGGEGRRRWFPYFLYECLCCSIIKKYFMHLRTLYDAESASRSIFKFKRHKRRRNKQTTEAYAVDVGWVRRESNKARLSGWYKEELKDKIHSISKRQFERIWGGGRAKCGNLFLPSLRRRVWRKKSKNHCDIDSAVDAEWRN